MPVNNNAVLKGTIDTSSVLASALERLNRKSVVGLLERLMDEINTQYDGVDNKINAAKTDVIGDITTARTEIKAITDKQTGDIATNKASVDRLRDDLDNHLQDHRTNLNTSIDERITLKRQAIIDDAVSAADTKIDAKITALVSTKGLDQLLADVAKAKVDIAAAQTAADALSSGEINQVKLALDEVLKTKDLSEVVGKAEIPVNGTPVRFDTLLAFLANQPKVTSVSMAYVNDHISGATFSFTNNTQAVFTAARDEAQPDSLIYVFRAPSMFGMNGLDGEFRLTFKKRAWQKAVCGNNLTMSQYDAVHQSNVLYNLAIG